MSAQPLRLALFLASIACCEPAPAAAPPEFDIVCRKKDDAVKVALHDGRTVLTVVSPSGIGSATVTRKDERWPQPLVLRLRLRGLESFAVAAGRTALGGAFSSHREGGSRLHLRQEGKEGPPLTNDSPYWTDIRAFDAQGNPLPKGLPGEGGYFEIALPKALLEEPAKSLNIEWIDFYR